MNIVRVTSMAAMCSPFEETGMNRICEKHTRTRRKERLNH